MIIPTPVLAWTVPIGSFVFFDALRTYNSSIKATLCGGRDILSRPDQHGPRPMDIEGPCPPRSSSHLVRQQPRQRPRFGCRRSTTLKRPRRNSLRSGLVLRPPNGEARPVTPPNLATWRRLLPTMGNAEGLILVQILHPLPTRVPERDGCDHLLELHLSPALAYGRADPLRRHGDRVPQQLNRSPPTRSGVARGLFLGQGGPSDTGLVSDRPTGWMMRYSRLAAVLVQQPGIGAAAPPGGWRPAWRERPRPVD